MRFIVIATCVGLVGLAAFPTPVLAQQKTIKACQEEWRATNAAPAAPAPSQRLLRRPPLLRRP
jgi:hypothetical protein